MKSVAGILLILFSFLTVQPLLAMAQASPVQEEACTMPCCRHHKEKKEPVKPMKGMCGDMSCNPFGEYACCTGFIVSNKTVFTFIAEKIWKKNILQPQSYSFDFISNCWQPPENTVTALA